MRAELGRLHARLGTTTIYVTHDQVEAMTLGQRVAVMRDGEIQQIAPPQDLYRNPANVYVSAFIGSPPMNLCRGKLREGVVEFAGIQLPSDKRRGNRDVIVGIRPEAFEDSKFATNGEAMIDVTPTVVEALGPAVHVIFPVDAPKVDSDGTRATSEDMDDSHLLLADDENLFTASVSPLSQIRPGVAARLSVSAQNIHLFDPSSGESLGDGRQSDGSSASLG